MNPVMALCCFAAANLFLHPPPGGEMPPGHMPRASAPDLPPTFQCRFDHEGKETLIEVPLAISSPTTEAQLDQLVELPEAFPPLRLTRFLPRAVREQNFVPVEGEDGKKAIEISIEGPTQSISRWLVADDPERNRLTSLIGSWRYMAVADAEQRDELFGLFQNEFTREPLLLVSGDDGGDVRKLPAKPGAARSFEDLGCTVRVRQFFPDFGMDHETNQPVNLTDARRNPAALVEIEQGGRKEERWVFAKFPGFRDDKTEKLRYRILLDCPLARTGDKPDFALVSVGRTDHELWGHTDLEHTSRAILLDERVEVPGSQYTFRIAKCVPAGRLVEAYVPTDARRAVTALQIETTDRSGVRTVLWLERGKERVISTSGGPVSVSLSPGRKKPMGSGGKCPH
jgi:hypothetical protein